MYRFINITYRRQPEPHERKVRCAYSTGNERPHAVTDVGTSHYTYDANGNMTGRPFDGVNYTLAYDAENRLIGISNTGLSASYTYDRDGNRVKREVTDQEGTHTTGYVGDYFEISLGTPIEPPSGDPPDCGTSYCMFFPMVLGGMGAPAGQAWVSYQFVCVNTCGYASRSS